MTAVMNPPEADVDLEAWLEHEIEVPCMIMHAYLPVFCGRPSDWMGQAKTGCNCKLASQIFLCESCKERCVDELGARCGSCHTPVLGWRWVERVREPK